MTEADYLTYIGAFTGAIGALTGIVGAVAGVIAYRRTNQIKALELQLELRKEITTLHHQVADLAPLLLKAKTSRERASAAMGTPHSGAFGEWLTRWTADCAALATLRSELPDANANLGTASLLQLTETLALTHSLSSRAEALRTKYQGSFAADDTDREHIRAKNERPG